MNENKNEVMFDADYNIDPTNKIVNEAAAQKNNQRMIDELNAANNNFMHGYHDNKNLGQDASNSSLSNPGNPNAPGTTQNAETGSKSATSPNTAKRNVSRGPSVAKNGRNISGLNSKSAQRIREASNRSFMRKAGAAAAAAGGVDRLLGAQENNKAKRQGMFGRLLDSIFGGKTAQDSVEEQSASQVAAQGTKKMVKIASIIISGPITSFALILGISLLILISTLDNMGISGDKLINNETTMNQVDKKLDKMDDDDMQNGVDEASNKEVSLSAINTSYPIYSIKLSKANVLALKDGSTGSSILDSDDYDFDLEKLKELYPSATDYKDVEYADIFFAKLHDLNEYYKSECGDKQVLDLPLLMITLKLESDNMAEVFASNVGVNETGVFIRQNIDEKYFDIDYDWSDYEYSPTNSIHDMEILAQHMVLKRGDTYCKYDDAGYREFLKEYIEKKYFLGKETEIGYYTGEKSSNYFQTYDLTEFQLIEIANLCGREQGHSNPAGAAAEASLMANLFEERAGSFAAKYSSNAEALYYYVRLAKKDGGWWHDAAKYMSERKATPEVIEAVRDVLVNGNRTLPKYVNTHDCFNCGSEICPSGKVGDICKVVTNGITYTTKEDVANRSHYIPHRTIVVNVYGPGEKIFYGFPSSAGDPFSYKDVKLREKYGECHYDFNTKEFVDCVDFRELIVKWAVTIASDDSHGYSQSRRNSLVDFDCSSLVYYSLINNGFTTTQLGSKPFTTATERDYLKRVGFTEIAVNSDCSNLQVGDILWREGHTEIYIGEGMTVGAHSASNNTIEDNLPGDQSGKEIAVVNIVKNGYWTYAYRYEK